MNKNELLNEAKERLEKRRKNIDEWRDKVKDIEEPDLIVSGTFTEIEKKRREKLGDHYDEEE